MLRSKIDRLYEIHPGERVCQGDIFRNVDFEVVTEEKVIENGYPYVVVISQDCDLQFGVTKEDNSELNGELRLSHQFLPNILFLPAFLAEHVRSGEHLEDLYGIKQEHINSTDWKLIKQNRNERYHYLPSYLDFQIPELAIDFKHYFSLPTESSIVRQLNNSYLATVNELFREDLSRRFSNYLSRIPLPEVQ